MRVIVFIAICAYSCTVAAKCVRYKPPREGTPPVFDGPGSWGPLQDTVTLDCLRYVGSVERKGKEQVLIRDERGRIYELKLGSFMGENTGRIVKIDAGTIYVEQLVRRGDEWQSVIVKFPK